MRDGWQEFLLSEIAELDGCKPESFTGVRYYVDTGSVSGRKISDELAAVTYSNRPSRANEDRCAGDVGFSKMKLSDKTVLVTAESQQHLFSTGFQFLRPKPNVVPEFLFLICSSSQFRQDRDALTGDGIMGSISKRNASSIKILLPPRPDQSRIVDLIGSIDWYIDSLQTQVEVTRAARSAVLFDLLSHLSAEWDEARLIDVCDVYQPKTISKSEMQDDGAYVVYGANGPIGRFSKFNHDQPEVVVTCRGATCGTLNVTPPNVWITGNAMVVSPKNERLTKSFLLVALEAADLTPFISGSAQPQITRSMLGQLIIPVPPRAEQMEISKVAGSFDEQLRGLRCQLEAVRVFRGGVVAELLSGERLLDESYDVAASL